MTFVVDVFNLIDNPLIDDLTRAKNKSQMKEETDSKKDQKKETAKEA